MIDLYFEEALDTLQVMINRSVVNNLLLKYRPKRNIRTM